MKKKVRIIRWVTIILVSVVLSLLVCGAYYLYSNFSFNKNFEAAKIKKVIKKSKTYEFNLFMVGDALIHESVYYNARQSDGSYDFKQMIDLIKPISSSYDLSYYNQDTILGGTSLGLSHYPRFNSP